MVRERDQTRARHALCPYRYLLRQRPSAQFNQTEGDFYAGGLVIATGLGARRRLHKRQDTQGAANWAARRATRPHCDSKLIAWELPAPLDRGPGRGASGALAQPVGYHPSSR
jgi:hypothetical protein